VQQLAQSVEQLATITRDVKHASDEQAAGGSQILEAMSELRTQAGTVAGLTGEQTERGTEVARIADELQSIIAQNKATIQRLEAVVQELRSADGTREVDTTDPPPTDS
jgi:methyl-accepting chemotaxis protein